MSESRRTGRRIPWRRDLADMYAFHTTIPDGVSSIDIALEYIAAPEAPGSPPADRLPISSRSSVGIRCCCIRRARPPDQLNYQADLKVPAGWRYGTALPIENEAGEKIQFKPSSLTTLIDSPVLMGAYFKTIDLSPGSTPPHYLHIAADSEHATEAYFRRDHALPVTWLRKPARCSARATIASYHFLLTLSDHVAHFGLEHHESSDDRTEERVLIDDSLRRADADLLSHEMTHSWNGKYRRPAGLATPDYDEPMKGNLLWVYEGLTQYYGEVLTPRSGLLTPDEFRQEIAREAAMLDTRTGRAWRPLQDTADAAQLLYDARKDYADLRRGVDYYEEGMLIWLEADVTIRQLSHGTKSLDDFMKAFEGPPSSGPTMKPYTFEDVVQAMNSVQPYDWAGFFRERLQSTAPPRHLAAS